MSGTCLAFLVMHVSQYEPGHSLNIPSPLGEPIAFESVTLGL